MPDFVTDTLAPSNRSLLFSDRDWAQLPGLGEGFRVENTYFPRTLNMPLTWAAPARVYTIKRSVGGILETLRMEVPDAAASPAWTVPTIECLVHVLGLLSDWNSYGAPQVTANAAFGAVSVLNRYMSYDSPAPTVVPTSRGGIQMEWHERGIDLELEILPSGERVAYFEDVASGDWWDARIQGADERLVAVFERLNDSQSG